MKLNRSKRGCRRPSKPISYKYKRSTCSRKNSSHKKVSKRQSGGFKRVKVRVPKFKSNKQLTPGELEAKRMRIRMKQMGVTEMPPLFA
jgi:hypothetical protein